MAFASGTLALTINQPSYFMQDSVVAYQPFNGPGQYTSLEIYRNQTWVGTSDTMTGKVPMQIADGFLGDSISSQYICAPSGYYGVTPVGSGTMMFAFWASGYGTIELGWRTDTGAGGIRDGFKLDFQYNYVTTSPYKNGVQLGQEGLWIAGFPSLFSPSSPEYWTPVFCIFILEQTATLRRFSMHLQTEEVYAQNNQGWVSGTPSTSTTATHLGISWNLPSVLAIDDLCIWKGNFTRPTYAERMALYNLGNNGSGMNEFYRAYGVGYIPHFTQSGSLPLFIKNGVADTTPNPFNLYIKGAMHYLHEDDMSMHVRMDDLTPRDPGHNQNAIVQWNDAYLVPMRLTQGSQFDPEASARFAFAKCDHDHATLDGRDFIAAAFWISGIVPPPDNYWSNIFIGYMANTPTENPYNFSPVDGLYISFDPDFGMNAYVVANELSTQIGATFDLWSDPQQNHLIFVQAYYVGDDPEFGSMWQGFASIDGRPFVSIGDPVPAYDIAWLGSAGGIHWRGMHIAQDPLNSFVIDEAILWTSHSDPFTDLEAAQLWLMGTQLGLSFDQYGTEYITPSGGISLVIGRDPVTVSGVVPTCITGYSPSSGTMPLMVQCKQEFLHHDDVLFYHPCESGVVEYTKQLVWNSYKIQDSGSRQRIAQVGSGYYHTDQFTTQWIQTPSGNYASCNNDSSWTFAFWVSGGLESTGLGCLHFGWGGISNIPYSNTMSYGWKWNTSQHYLHARTRGATDQNFLISSADTYLTTERLIVMRIEFHDGSGYPMVSQNGGSWKEATPQAMNTPDNTNGYLGFGMSALSHEALIDEVIGWRNTGKFTTQELSNLYTLGVAHKGMNRYLDTFGTSVSGNASAYTKGCALASGSMPFYVKAGYEDNDISCYINGLGFSSGVINAYVNGIGPSSSASGYVNMYTTGIFSTSGSMPIYLHSDWQTGYMPMFLQCMYQQIPLRITGGFVGGLYAKVQDTTQTRIAPLIIYGSTDPGSLFRLGQIDLYMLVPDSYSTATCITNAFAKVALWSVPSSGIFSGFVKTQNHYPQSVYQMDLFLNAGLTSSIGFYIQGSGELFYDGFTQLTTSNNMFARVHDGHVRSCDMWISGYYGENHFDVPFWTEGCIQRSGIVNIYIALGTNVSGWCALYMPPPPAVTVVSSSPGGNLGPRLYVHGF